MWEETKDRPFVTASVVGLGYIGLPTAALVADHGLKVFGLDVNEALVAEINSAQLKRVEQALDDLVAKMVNKGNLSADLQAKPADVFLITVPTPFKASHQADLQYIEAACYSIAPVLKKGDLVILESTSPVGTTEKLSAWLAIARPDLSFPKRQGKAADVQVAYCPERVLPGFVLDELVNNDRIIGGMTQSCSLRALAFYKIFVKGDCLITDVRTAELCKLTENSFRDVNIAFSNEISIICDKLGIDVWELIHLANRHPRVNLLEPGPGVGGHCISVDPWFIVSENEAEAQLIRTAREVNDAKPDWVLTKIKDTIAAFLKEAPLKTAKDVTILCFGLTFKPDIEDLRESPALSIVERLTVLHSGPILIVEPHISALPPSLSQKAALKEAEDGLLEADLVLILVNHREFYSLFKKIDPRIKVIDTRGITSSFKQR